MAFGADLTAPQTKQDVAQYAGTLVAFLKNFQTWSERVQEVGAPALGALYATLYTGDADATAKGAADAADLLRFVAALQAVTAYAVAPVAVTPTDNTAGSAAVTTVVPAGGYAVTTQDPRAVFILLNLGDKGAVIRAGAPLNG